MSTQMPQCFLLYKALLDLLHPNSPMSFCGKFGTHFHFHGIAFGTSLQNSAWADVGAYKACIIAAFIFKYEAISISMSKARPRVTTINLR